MPDTPLRLFISYSRNDSDFVDKLQADLQARNFDAWVDRRNLEGGRDWAEMIEHAIDRCQVVIVVLSPDALESEWVKKEYSYAQDTGKQVIPLQFRSVGRIPIRLNELQRINFEFSYEQGIRDLLITLTPIAVVHYPPPAEIPSAEPAVENGTQDDLVVIRPAPPLPNPNLEALYRAGLEANVDGDLERAAILWEQVLVQDSNFQEGLLKVQMDALMQNLRPIRIQRLRDRARAAMENQDWRQAAGAWNALLGQSPSDPEAIQGLHTALQNRAQKARNEGFWGEEIGAWEALLKLEPQNESLRERLSIAEQNQRWEYKYKSAQEFAQAGKLAPAKAELELLWSKAPYYGDPANMAPQLGLVAPLSYEEQKKAEIEATHQAEINRQAEIEARRQAELEAYRLAEIERRRQAELEAYHQAEVEAEIKTQKKSQSRLLQILWISVGIAFGGAVVITILGGILANVPGLSYNLIFAGLILFAIGVFWTIGGTIFWGENQIYFRLSQDRSRSLRFQLSRIGIFIWCIASVIGLISIAIGSSTLQGCPATAVSNATCPSGIGAWVSDISFGVLSFSCLGIIAAFIFFVLTLVVGRRR